MLLLTLQWHGRSQAPAAKKVAVAETPRDDVMDLTHKYDAVEAEIKRATSSKEAVDELFQVVGGGYTLNLLSPPHPLHHCQSTNLEVVLTPVFAFAASG